MRINFKWINPGDKIVLKVVHRSPSDNIRVRGSFHGISRVTRMDDDYNKLAYTRRHIVCVGIVTAIGTMLLIALVLGGLILVHRGRSIKTK